MALERETCGWWVFTQDGDRTVKPGQQGLAWNHGGVATRSLLGLSSGSWVATWPKASSGRNEATFRESMTSREGEIDKKSFFFLHASDVRLDTLWPELKYKPAFKGPWEIKQ